MHPFLGGNNMSHYQVGKKIRDLRKSKGLTITEFSKELGVSAGYLSNLETEKTETISISLIEKLEKNYHLRLFQSKDKLSSEIDDQVERLSKGLVELYELNKDQADYLIDTLQRGLNLFLS
jgi:transcriptional regulator with XRE-family HTH domain